MGRQIGEKAVSGHLHRPGGVRPASAGVRRSSLSQDSTSAADRLVSLQREAGNQAVAVGFDAAHAVVMMVETLIANYGEGVLGFDAWFNLRLALLNAASDIGTAEIMAQTALIEAQTAQIEAEIAATREETARLVDHNAGHPGDRAFERLEVLAALAGGETSDVELTDVVFLTRHPERRSAPLQPGNAGDARLIQEWTRIRTSIVREVSSSALGKAMRLPKEPAGAGQGA